MKHRYGRTAATLLLAVLMMTGLLAGCANGTSAPSASAQATTAAAMTAAAAPSAPAAGGLDKDGVTSAEGLPITSQPVTITAAANYSSLRPNVDTTNVWKYVSQKTNLNFKVEILKDADKVDLMFAGGDLPDVIMGVGIKANQLTNAVESGSFVEMEPLIKQYAPTWYSFMQENRLAYNASLATDGKLYSLPYIDFAPFDRNLRDQWVIMKSWLDELGLKTPTTTQEFKDVLTAFKKNAGKGSIPADVVPYYFFFDSYVGGQFDIYGSFGVYVTSDDYVYVDNKVVKDQATNPAIKEPLKYLRDLYAAGLVPPEVFTDDWNTYVSKISSKPPIVGAYHSYANRQPELGVAMGPLNSGNGSKPLIRSQAYTPGPAHTAIITKNNPYPVATTRFFELMAKDSEMMLTVSRGTKGIVWDTNKDGKAYQLFWEESPDKMTANAADLGLHNGFIALKDANFYQNIWEEVTYQQPNSRGWAYQNVYKDVVMPNDMVYVGGTLGTDDNNMLNQYKTDLANYRKAMFADFITGKQDIDGTWDAYVAQMNKLGLKEFIALKQKAYDLMIK